MHFLSGGGMFSYASRLMPDWLLIPQGNQKLTLAGKPVCLPGWGYKLNAAGAAAFGLHQWIY
jgi:hypothetical protein